MKKFIKQDEWCIIEEGFHPEFNLVSESLFSLGNGYMGIRGNFEEDYSGESLPGSYISGIYYPEPMPDWRRKVGLPEYYMKRPNAANWLGIHVEFDGEAMDLANCQILSFRRVLNMQEGTLERIFHIRQHSGNEVQVRTRRFCSLASPEVAAVHFAVTPLNFSGTLTLTPYVDLNVSNVETSVAERFWVEVETMVRRTHAYVVAETRKTEFQVCTGMKFDIFQRGNPIDFSSYRIQREKYVACSVDLPFHEGEETVLVKYVANLSSLNHPKEGLLERCKHVVKQASRAGFDYLLEEHRQAWAGLWSISDILIEGDVAIQQAVRFNIFHLHQAYNGHDERLSISPKGFTGERYGGCTYWSAEIFCLPFFLAAYGGETGQKLLLYRYNQLPQAIENAGKLGIRYGAALFPMTTMDGTESSTDWEIALEEIHRNGAVAYAIFEYVRQTGDRTCLIDYGLEVLIAIARYWAQRVHYSEQRQQYVLHGVTGPNEYDNNVNNNWYTNYQARWCLNYAIEAWQYVREAAPAAFRMLADRIGFHEFAETGRWRDISENLFLPFDEKRGIFPQHDGYLDKELPTVASLLAEERPLYKHWSWDRILRSGFIKRADVLHGLWLFQDQFEEEELRRNFKFYEPRTVHESSLSYSVHAILACRLREMEKAYALFLRSARLDLDDYNGDTSNGCHVTSMGGAWLALVQGFGGLRMDNQGRLILEPVLPARWNSLSFSVIHKSVVLRISIDRNTLTVCNDSQEGLTLWIEGAPVNVEGNNKWVGQRNNIEI